MASCAGLSRLLCFCAVECLWRAFASQTGERNNWAVIVETSRYWYNYRHVANSLSFYHTVKRLGLPDSNIILMVAEDMACNARNTRPGTVFNDMNHRLNLYGEDVEVDYRGDEVSVDNFLRLLTGRHPPNTPRSKRLLTDSASNIFIFITGHSGDEFIKFQDWEEITSNDIADAFAQMHKQRRYNQILWLSDTCQAASLQNKFYSPGLLAMANSGRHENGYSHHMDPELGVAVIDRFTYYALDFLNKLTTRSEKTMQDFLKVFNPNLLKSHPEIRSDLFTKKPNETLITEFLASTGQMRFQSTSVHLLADTQPVTFDGTCKPQSSKFASCMPRWGSGGQVGNETAEAQSTHVVGPLVVLWHLMLRALPWRGAGQGLEPAMAQLVGSEVEDISVHPQRWHENLASTCFTGLAWLLGFAFIIGVTSVLL